MRRRALGVLAVVALAASTLVPAASAAADPAPPGAIADDGARVVRETPVDARTVDLVIDSPAVGTTTVRLLLPPDWTARPTLRWPTLYLLGGVDPLDYQAWTHYTDVESFTATSNVLVVMPSAGAAAVYSDQYAFGGRGPKWETFHTTELPQLLERGYRSNGSNAVAGLSAGGFGALAYTFRHPGLFKATASYSGLTDLFDPGAVLAQWSTQLKTGSDSQNPFADLLTTILASPAHNPQSNPMDFVKRKLYLSCGAGLPGPLDNAYPGYRNQTGGRLIESVAYEMNSRFAATVQLLGGHPTTHFYTGGLHYWPYWQREFHSSFPMLMKAVGGPTTGVVG